ncbi:hypothetical protein C9374_013985 [Naegleria lovaniensis]|uniref:Cell differentiation protein rcd1 n=1 Tax=Naegleria lovaniensis TaxID=51637 RepID=A0AA88KMX7_NAELO|nr:uncharacterized protein C9374_013985 [Naegleria lovaniensis]KAG2389425.1 hypothetical protein C9374_013985 [Naegleria lovaniensis]
MLDLHHQGFPQQNPSNANSEAELMQYIVDLLNHGMRENALIELSKRRDSFPHLAPVLWFSTGVMSVLLQEIVSVYDLLDPPTLTSSASNRVCNALALLQCVASHPETRPYFLNAHIPLFMYPFLNTVAKSKSFEYLRLTSLGVIGALVKSDEDDVINFLLPTEIIPLCLRIMESGTELSQTVATFIIQKILHFEKGLNYICATPERFYAVCTVFGNMVNDNPSFRLLKHIIRCYYRLSDHTKAREALTQCLPKSLRDKTFQQFYDTDVVLKNTILGILQRIGDMEGYQRILN